MDVNGLSAISSSQLKPLKPVLCDLKSKFSLLLKIKYQRFNGNVRPPNCYNLRPLLVFAGPVPLRREFTGPE
jgi:hypothetical protein